ncbi:hypothetical protein [Paenibacillus prosopidis]|uniref:Uncharacterized protein n=1 Tax=Paenibacillus prosopidis TaxID=630520 RepID=A0A368VLR6_9BACL|nr:hypothetical protein [Paenibacillus prosopidis]RCW42460.1 hypothetical protein DFP97_11622 [Paenibacillus prosopidis]
MNPVNSTGLWFDPILINNPNWIQHQATDYSPGWANSAISEGESPVICAIE